MQYIRIPRERVSVLIGKGGSVKREIERKTGVRLRIDSEEGTVDINEKGAVDPISALKVRDLVKAIGRGFNPKVAMDIIDRDMYFHLVDIREYTGKKPRRIREMKGRMIGQEGKTKRIIQDLAECSICIYGHTVAIIAELDSMEVARAAVDMVLSGSRHASVYSFLERKRRASKMQRSELFYDADTVLGISNPDELSFESEGKSCNDEDDGEDVAVEGEYEEEEKEDKEKDEEDDEDEQEEDGTEEGGDESTGEDERGKGENGD